MNRQSDATSITVVLARSTAAPRQARRAVQDLLGDEVPIVYIRDAILLTSELVTNVVQHTQGGCRLRAWFDAERHSLRVEVGDSSRQMPVLRDDPTRESGGRGLRIVDEIATRWGARPTARGKTTWFELEA